MLRLLCPLLWLVICTPAAMSQSTERTISGLVTSAEDGTPLEGVQVTAKGSGVISGTQQDGMYYIQVTGKDSVLVFSGNGLATREVRLTATCDYNIQLSKGQSVPSHAISAAGTWRAVFQLARIHTGYSGPATGPYYEEFVKEFNKEIDGLL